MTKSTSATAEDISKLYEKAQLTARQLTTELADIEKAIFKDEEDPRGNLGVIQTLAGTVSVVNRTVASEILNWRDKTKTRK